MKYVTSNFCVLALLWLGNSGHYSPLLLGLGLVSVVFVVWICWRMNVVDHESQPVHLFTAKLPAYYGWLAVKIIQGNIDVVRCILRGNPSISPCVESLPMGKGSDMGKVIYANSMTLTPGTVAMDLQGDRVLVQALTRAAMDDLLTGEMQSRVAQLERQGETGCWPQPQ